MATTIARRPAVQPVSGTCRLTLAINGTAYTVRPIRENDGRLLGFRLLKDDGESYDIDLTFDAAHPTCECRDFLTRRANRDPKGCKHIAAMRACGLVS